MGSYSFLFTMFFLGTELYNSNLASVASHACTFNLWATLITLSEPRN